MPSPSTQDSSRPAIAVLGAGRMGAPIAHNLLAAGFEVSVWDRSAESAAALAADGARLASSAAEAAAVRRVRRYRRPARRAAFARSGRAG
jgi:3-hydroxyacyl-CoA dehydrogenase